MKKLSGVTKTEQSATITNLKQSLKVRNINMKYVFCFILVFSALHTIAQEPRWWTEQKQKCKLDAKLAYNTWVAQGMPCYNQQPIPTGPTPEELKKQSEAKDLKEASDDANDKGVEFYKKNDWTNAIKYFTEALDYNPDNDDAIDNLKLSRNKAAAEAQRMET